MTTQQSRKCKRCEDGIDIHEAVTLSDGKVIPERRYKCTTCGGVGDMLEPNWDAIFEAITTLRGSKSDHTRRFRQSAPEAWKKSNQGVDNRRAYYVWRLARFHGGADVTMPMTASLFCGDDAWRPELDAYAEAVARAVFGTDMAAAHRWYNALGGNANIPGLPASAYSGGPVQDGNKPGFEKEELK